MNNNYLDTENKIIGNLIKKPLFDKSKNQISKETGLSYVTIHKIIPLLEKKRMIKIEKKGRADMVSVDLENAQTDRISSAMLYEKDKFLKKEPKLKIIINELEESLAENFFILVLFGSYAKGNFTKESDVDLLFITPSRKVIDEYKKKVKTVLKMHSGKIHINLVSSKDFMNMLEEKNTLGRSVFKNSIVLFGTEQYYAMVKKYVREKGY